MMAQMTEFFNEVRESKPSNRSMRARATSILDDVGVTLVEKRKSVLLGNDLRLESARFTVAGLEFEDQRIQFSLFGSENGNGSGHRVQDAKGVCEEGIALRMIISLASMRKAI